MGINIIKPEEQEDEIKQLKGELRQWQLFAIATESAAIGYEKSARDTSHQLIAPVEAGLKGKALREIIELMPVAKKNDK